jgi:hypothetical protein
VLTDPFHPTHTPQPINHDTPQIYPTPLCHPADPAAIPVSILFYFQALGQFSGHGHLSN